MYCITFHLQKRAIYRCLSPLLLIGLLLQAFTSLESCEAWDEALVPWARKCWSRGRRRLVALNCLDLLKRRGWVLFCRLGLMAVLLVWGGWPRRSSLSWGLLSLPLIDALLSLLLLFWPGVLKRRTYPCLVCKVHDVYLLMLRVLFSEGLSHPKDGRWLFLVSGCVQVADGAWARGEIEEDGTWRLEMKGHFLHLEAQWLFRGAHPAGSSASVAHAPEHVQASFPAPGVAG